MSVWHPDAAADYWPTGATDPSATPAEVEFARIWKDKPKVVFSRTLDRGDWNSRLVRDGAVAEVARLKAQPGFDMGVGGPTIASSVMQAGLIDEYRIFVNPVILGAGTPFFPTLEDRVELRLLETRTFGSEVVYLRYAAVGDRLRLPDASCASRSHRRRSSCGPRSRGS